MLFTQLSATTLPKVVRVNSESLLTGRPQAMCNGCQGSTSCAWTARLSPPWLASSNFSALNLKSMPYPPYPSSALPQVTTEPSRRRAAKASKPPEVWTSGGCKFCKKPRRWLASREDQPDPLFGLPQARSMGLVGGKDLSHVVQPQALTFNEGLSMGRQGQVSDVQFAVNTAQNRFIPFKYADPDDNRIFLQTEAPCY